VTTTAEPTAPTEKVPEAPGPTDDEKIRALEDAAALRYYSRPDMTWDPTRNDGDGGLRPMNIHERMIAILGELPAIGKDQVNTQQNFKFRGYDDALKALNPLLAKYRVYYVPEVVERVRDVRTTRQGGNMFETSLHVRFTFYGPAGDSVVGDAWGEGTDSGDKSTPKAHTGSMKVLLFQAFAISTEESSATDPDFTTPEETVPPAPPPPEPNATPGMVEGVMNRLVEYGNAHGQAPPEWTTKGFPKAKALQEILDGNRPPPQEATVRRWAEVLDDAVHAEEQERIKNTPCEVCHSVRSERVVVEGVVRCSRRNDCDARAARQAAAAAEGSGEPQDGPQEGQEPEAATGEAAEPEAGS